MADKVDKKPASLLPVAVEEKKKKAAPFPAVQLASLWALFTAVMFVGSLAFTRALTQFITLPSWLREEAELTVAAAAEERAIRHGVAWSTAAQAAAAALAQLLPERRRGSRRALAHFALAATAATHLMFARVVTLFLVADPGDIFWWTVGTADILILAAGDITCFLALLGRLDQFS
ncbi:unnamed protein product [Urochloa decumbens]|uniref:Transmembrane protein n=1 Tax=Urochloa decumbens TaxID=240449 RepID=A0ABC8Z0G0_9POAL